MKLFSFSVLTLISLLFSPENESNTLSTNPEIPMNTVMVDHAEWTVLLKKYVDNDGNVDYKAFKKDEKALDTYLKNLAQHKPEPGWQRAEELAYYINLYNAGTVKLILKKYPIESIKDIKKPWDQKWLKIGAKSYSLGHIEHKILRKMNEPRIHFAINCASFSCPKLLNEAFISSTLEAQLQQATIDFVNDPKRNTISSEKLEISSIFKWFKEDFTENGTLTDYLQAYTTTPINDQVKISFMNYDWRLNETE